MFKFLTEKKTTSILVRKVSFLLFVITLGLLCVAASKTSVNTFVVYEGENVTVLNSNSKATSEAINELGIVIDETKYAKMPEYAENGLARIYIYPKKVVTVIDAGIQTVLYTEDEKLLSDLLVQNNITLGADDIISIPVTTQISDGMKVEITRVSFSDIETYQEIPYSTEKRPNKSMNKGSTKIIQPGNKGSKKVIHKVEFRNGAEFQREIIKETTQKEPTTEIIEYGTKPVDTSGVVTTWSGQKLNYKKKINMTATAYTTERTSDKITATGQVAKVGLVAVDPRVIPLGTKLYIVSADGKSWCYGTAVAGDTGVRGNKIDLFFNTYNECISFGRRKATVYILK